MICQFCVNKSLNLKKKQWWGSMRVVYIFGLLVKRGTKLGWFSGSLIKRRKVNGLYVIGNSTTLGMATVAPIKKPCAESMQPQPHTPHRARP